MSDLTKLIAADPLIAEPDRVEYECVAHGVQAVDPPKPRKVCVQEDDDGRCGRPLKINRYWATR